MLSPDIEPMTSKPQLRIERFEDEALGSMVIIALDEREFVFPAEDALHICEAILGIACTCGYEIIPVNATEH